MWALLGIHIYGGYMRQPLQFSIPRQVILVVLLVTSLLLGSALGLSSCRSSQKVTIDSEPMGANVYVNNELAGQTPTEISISGGQKVRIDLLGVGEVSNVPPPNGIRWT